MTFLASLYTSTNVKIGKILSAASDLQIKLVLKLLYFIVKKEIPITERCIKNMQMTKSCQIIFKIFKETTKVIKLLKSPRSVQMNA